MSKKILRCVRLVDCDPADVNGSDVVSESNESAVDTLKVFSVSILFGYVSTVWTGATCISWVNKSDWNSSEFCFIFDKTAKLVETPRVLSATLGLANRYPRADARQVFEGDPAFGVFSFRNQLLRDDVVHISGEAKLFSGTFLQQPFCRLCSFALKLGSKFYMSFSYSVDFVSAPRLPIRVYSYISNAEVNSKPLLSIISWRLRDVHSHGEVEGFVSDNEVALTSDSIELFGLVDAILDGDEHSAFHCQYRDSINSFPREDALVVDYCPIFSEGWLSFLVSFVGFSYFAYCSDGQLSRQTIFASDIVVDELLKFHLVSCSLFKRYMSYLVTSLVESIHCFKKSVRLLRRGQKFHKESLLHNVIDNMFQYKRVILQFLPCLKTWASLEGFR